MYLLFPYLYQEDNMQVSIFNFNTIYLHQDFYKKIGSYQ